MNWTIGRRVTAGFIGMLLLVTAMGITTVISMKTLSNTVQNLYAHPFSVSRAILKAEAKIKGSQFLLQNWLLAEKPVDPLKSNVKIEQLDADIRKNLDLVNERFLGAKSELEDIRALLVEWRSTRDKVIDLVAKDRREEAIRLFRASESVVLELNRKIAYVSNFAEEKAESFLNVSTDTAVTTISLSVALLIGILLAGSGLAFFGTRAITRQLKESITQLSSSASEILATTTQVASGAAETATAVSETTATVEEVKQTAQLASQKARQVSDSAQKVAQVSQTGRQSVEEVIAGMHRIQEQMESIADSIVRLSEQSQAIGEIIATVNDLAEQSNVLAVNAAIEASRAGEQGKSFGVVAQEVKSLAEQSKQATAQVRTILGDIQKATSAAVLATEQGHKAVEAGVKQSAAANDSIRKLAESINEAAQAATQIAASSQQQMVGMDQVALAMDNIKQASTQNVAGTRQAEVAAQNLHELGIKLGALIGRSAT